MTQENTAASANTVGSASPKPRKSPVPQQYDRILAGALKLTMKERADIANALIAQNKKELAGLQQQAKEAEQLLNGSPGPITSGS